VPKRFVFLSEGIILFLSTWQQPNFFINCQSILDKISELEEILWNYGKVCHYFVCLLKQGKKSFSPLNPFNI